MQNSHQDRGQRDREEGGLAGQDPAQTSQRQPKHLSKPVGKQPENCRKKNGLKKGLQIAPPVQLQAVG